MLLILVVLQKNCFSGYIYISQYHITVQSFLPTEGVPLQWEEPDQVSDSDWLSRNLVAQYWKGEELDVDTGQYRTCQLNNDWCVLSVVHIIMHCTVL